MKVVVSSICTCCMQTNILLQKNGCFYTLRSSTVECGGYLLHALDSTTKSTSCQIMISVYDLESLVDNSICKVYIYSYMHIQLREIVCSTHAVHHVDGLYGYILNK